jgi:hypothetical protein
MHARPAAHVMHIVVCWLKNPGDTAARKQLIDESKAFASIPGVVSVSTGPVMPSTRPAVDSSFDVAVVMKFKDQASLEAYGKHPQHLAAIERTLKPLVTKHIVYDYTE